MRLRLVVSLAIGLLTALVALAQDATPKPELKAALQAIQGTLDKLTPAAKVEYDGSSTISVMYLPQEYMIHAVSEGGEVALEPHEEIGPSARGLTLILQRQAKGQINKPATPQTLRRPYWMIDIDVTPIAKSDQQIYWALAYGAQTDSKLLEEIRVRLRGLKD
ncbi:MAG TPA: hypothetical protein VGM98_18345 [Schlesneria sp.]|jgi:hypothetical protein